jgi:hypothetical protein
MKAIAPPDQCFFLPGDCRDPAYRNVRDNPRNNPSLSEGKAFIKSLWPRYRYLADQHFRQDAMNHFLARFWEMYLAVTLIERGFELKRAGNEGPELFFVRNGRKVWVEAVAPGPGEKEDDRVPGYRNGELADTPEEKILLRFTNTLNTKRANYNKALEKGVIAPDDCYLLAINSRSIPHAPYDDIVPFFVKAFLPLGTPAVRMDITTGKIVETFFQRRENIEKASGARVSINAGLDSGFSFVSAVLHSGVDCVNRPAILGEDFSILHWPAALPTHRLDDSVFSWCEQMFYQDNELERRPKQA